MYKQKIKTKSSVITEIRVCTAHEEIFQLFLKAGRTSNVQSHLCFYFACKFFSFWQSPSAFTLSTLVSALLVPGQYYHRLLFCGLPASDMCPLLISVGQMIDRNINVCMYYFFVDHAICVWSRLPWRLFSHVMAINQWWLHLMCPFPYFRSCQSRPNYMNPRVLL